MEQPPPSSSMSDPKRRVRKRWFLLGLIALWGLMFTGSHIPVDPDLMRHTSDKTLHFVGYGILTLVLGLYRQQLGPWTVRQAVLVLLIIAGYAAFDELTQPLVNRFCEFGDWVADMGGALMAVGLLTLWSWGRNKRTDPVPPLD